MCEYDDKQQKNMYDMKYDNKYQFMYMRNIFF